MKNFFQLRVDQWVLFGVLIAVGIMFAAKAFLGSKEQELAAQGKGKGPSKLLMEQYESIGKKWDTPPALALGKQRVFVPRLIVFSPKSGTIEWLDPDKEMDDGIKAGWKLKYGFSIEDPNLGNQDADNDGFTNKEEYEGQTDPTDPKSRPSILVKLKMVKFTYVPFRIQFKAANRLPDGSLQFQLNLLDVAQKKTRFAKTGEELEGYQVGEYRQNVVEEERGGVKYKVDRSELDLINPKLNETVKLILNTQQESDESHAKFKIDVPDAKLVPDEVKRGNTFKLIYNQDGQPAEMEFQLTKANAEGSTIKNVKTGETKEISVQK